MNAELLAIQNTLNAQALGTFKYGYTIRDHKGPKSGGGLPRQHSLERRQLQPLIAASLLQLSALTEQARQLCFVCSLGCNNPSAAHSRYSMKRLNVAIRRLVTFLSDIFSMVKPMLKLFNLCGWEPLGTLVGV